MKWPEQVAFWEPDGMIVDDPGPHAMWTRLKEAAQIARDRETLRGTHEDAEGI